LSNKEWGVKRGIKLALIVGLLSFAFVGFAKAEIFVNFDDPSAWIDGTSYGYKYIYNTSHGYIGARGVAFDPSISNTILEASYPDHTTGTGSFLSGFAVQLDFTNLDAYVNTFDLYWLGRPGIQNFLAAIGQDGMNHYLLGGDSSNPVYGDAQWHELGLVDIGAPISLLSFYTDFYYDSGTQNWVRGMAIDDLRLDLTTTATPEPASMSLLGLGLLGLVRRFRRK